jgi:ABC-type amino acid transport substrate-binding protein
MVLLVCITYGYKQGIQVCLHHYSLTCRCPFIPHYRNLYFSGDPVSIPTTCPHSDELVAVADADTSLTSVLDAGVVRVGISRVGGSFPLLYANETTDQGFVVSTDLEGGGELDGYEIASAKEAVRRIGVKYSVDLVAVFDVLPGPPFFPALEGALTDGIVDVAWTQIGVNNAREDQIDFTCPTFFTTYRITAGSGVGSTPPAQDGPTVKVACIDIFCTFDVPAPFEKVDVGLSGQDYDALLFDTTDEYDYNIGAVEEYVFLMKNDCPTCKFVDIEPVGTSSLAPATRQGPLETGRPTPSPTVDSSVCGSGEGLVTAAVMGALAAGVAAL